MDPLTVVVDVCKHLNDSGKPAYWGCECGLDLNPVHLAISIRLKSNMSELLLLGVQKISLAWVVRVEKESTDSPSEADGSFDEKEPSPALIAANAVQL